MIEMTIKEAIQELEETVVLMKKLGLIENESRMLSAIIMGKNALEFSQDDTGLSIFNLAHVRERAIEEMWTYAKKIWAMTVDELEECGLENFIHVIDNATGLEILDKVKRYELSKETPCDKCASYGSYYCVMICPKEIKPRREK